MVERQGCLTARAFWKFFALKFEVLIKKSFWLIFAKQQKFHHQKALKVICE